MVYLSDTADNQGAFTLIPGFHNIIDEWLESLPAGAALRDLQYLSDFTPKPIAAEAGDLIVWPPCLPHGSSPNSSNRPRIVQYINFQPVDWDQQMEWI